MKNLADKSELARRTLNAMYGKNADLSTPDYKQKRDDNLGYTVVGVGIACAILAVLILQVL